MREEVFFSLDLPYRDNGEIKAYVFGEGEKSLCIVGSTRGNEIQQTYLAAQMAHHLKKLEEKGRLVPSHQIMVIPTTNAASINVGKRFWPLDNTDINRMFPGYNLGETTQRIAAGGNREPHDRQRGGGDSRQRWRRDFLHPQQGFGERAHAGIYRYPQRAGRQVASISL